MRGKFFEISRRKLRAVVSMVESMCPHPEPAEGPELAEGVVDFSLPDLFICRSICVGMTTYNSRLMATYTF